MITGAELLEALPIIISLIVIEGLLSVDNALAIAAMASHLPGKQKYIALRLGIIGAYAFRGLVLLIAAWIIQNEWVKWFGAAYLVYLMCSHLTQAEHGEDESLGGKKKPGLFMTIAQIELMDLSLSVDNVIAAVALAPKGPDGQEKMWVVYTGVAIGILALRLAAGVCIRLLQKYPILAQTAFLLVGYVGFILVFELLTHIHIQAWQKFIGIVIITLITVNYSRYPVLQTIFDPIIKLALPLMRAFAGLLDFVFWPLRKLHEVIARMFRKAVPKEEVPS
jgi:tellurite resistance protein TerC